MHGPIYTKFTDINIDGGIRTSNTSKRVAADPHLRPRGLGVGNDNNTHCYLTVD